MKGNYFIVVNVYVANISFSAIRENKILVKISEFTVSGVLAADVEKVSASAVNGVEILRTAYKSNQTKIIYTYLFLWLFSS